MQLMQLKVSNTKIKRGFFFSFSFTGFDWFFIFAICLKIRRDIFFQTNKNKLKLFQGKSSINFDLFNREIT